MFDPTIISFIQAYAFSTDSSVNVDQLSEKVWNRLDVTLDEVTNHSVLSSTLHRF